MPWWCCCPLDLLTGFGLWAKPWLNRLRLAGLGLAALLIAFAFVQGNRAPVVVRHQVALPGLPAALDGMRLVALSDLHLGNQFRADWLARRIDQVEALRPDMIVLLGDIFEGHGDMDGGLEDQLGRLRAPLGVYAVTGNHEFYGDASAAIAMSERNGVVWLRDRHLEIRPGLVLVGIEDLTVRRQRGDWRDHMTLLLAGRPEGATLLLSHSPLQVETAARNGVGLMLSGHTHGGQIWPWSHVTRRIYPYFIGRYAIGDMTLIIGRGAGLWGPRMRLWHPGEILAVTLRAAD